MQNEQLTQIGEGGINASSLPMVLCEEMDKIIMNDEQFLNNPDGTAQYFKLSGYLSRIMYERSIYYEACPECKKKVAPNDTSNGYYCERCQKAFPYCNPSYNFTCRVGDFSGNVYGQVMGEPVGDQLLGMSARDMRVL